MYTEKQLVSFGNYLLSKEREDLIRNSDLHDSSILEDRLRQVNHADIENWKEKYGILDTTTCFNCGNILETNEIQCPECRAITYR